MYTDTLAYVRTLHLQMPEHDRVFHAYGWFNESRDDAVWRQYTRSRCGRVVGEYRNGVARHTYVRMHEDVAERVARPCRQCYIVTVDPIGTV